MDTFEVMVRKKDDVAILDLIGTLDAHTINILEDTFSSLINNGTYKIITNLARLEYITSAGLGVFMEFIEDIRENKGDIVFCEHSERLYQIFDLLGFPYIYKFFQDEKQALEYFQELNKNG